MVALPKGSTRTLTLWRVEPEGRRALTLTLAQRPTDCLEVSASERRLRLRWDAAPTASSGEPVPLKASLVGDPLAGYWTMMRPPVGGRSIPLRSEGSAPDSWKPRFGLTWRPRRIPSRRSIARRSRAPAAT